LPSVNSNLDGKRAGRPCAEHKCQGSFCRDVRSDAAPSDLWANYYAGLAAIQLGETAEAATLLETAALWATHDPEPSLALAQVYLAQGRYDQAADAARKALALDSRSAAARELLQSAEREK
jgi:tetratricopeptide (TPR) repeat protein